MCVCVGGWGGGGGGVGGMGGGRGEGWIDELPSVAKYLLLFPIFVRLDNVHESLYFYCLNFIVTINKNNLIL